MSAPSSGGPRRRVPSGISGDLALACLLLGLAGCTVTDLPGELSQSACDNALDDDDDGQMDCEDPDCQLYEHCRGNVSAPAPAAGSDGPVVVMTPFDAGAPGDAARPSLLIDGGGRCPEVPCPPSDDCVAGVCVPEQLVVGDQWVISSIQASVPRSASYSLANPMCVDTDCTAPVALPPFFLCGCPPDPKVKVLVDGELRGETDSAVNVDSKQWNTDITIILRADSEVRFEVVDVDSLSDELLYACSVEALPEVVATGTLACAQSLPTDTGNVPFGVQATVTLP